MMILYVSTIESSKRDVNWVKKGLYISFGNVQPWLEYANITIPQKKCVNDLGAYANRTLKWNTHTQC